MPQDSPRRSQPAHSRTTSVPTALRRRPTAPRAIVPQQDRRYQPAHPVQRTAAQGPSSNYWGPPNNVTAMLPDTRPVQGPAPVDTRPTAGPPGPNGPPGYIADGVTREETLERWEREGDPRTTNAAPEVLDYPTTPAPLSAMDIAELDARRRAAERQLRNAEAQRKFGTAEADRRLRRALTSIGVQFEKDERGARTSQAARGMAFAPMGLGRELVELRDERARSTLAAQEEKAVQVAALEEMVRQAEELRADELASVAQAEALLGSDLDELFQGVGA